MGSGPATREIDISSLVRPAIMVVLVAVVVWSFFLAGNAGPDAARPDPGVITDPLLAPQVARLIDAVDARPSDNDRRAALGRMYEANELYGPARATWQQLVELDPDNWIWRFRLAMTLEREGHLDAAIESMMDAATRAPAAVADPHWRLALWQIDMGQHAQAEASLERVPRSDEPLTPVLVAQVKLALNEGQYERAVTLLEQHGLVDSLPGGYGWNLFGQALRGQGRDDQAREAFGRAGNARPRFPDRFSQEMGRSVAGLRAMKDAVGAHIRARRWDRAIELSGQVIQHDPDDFVIRRLLGIAHWRSGDLDAARSELEAILQGERLPSTCWILGSVMLDQARRDRKAATLEAAYSMARQGLAIDPDHRNLRLLEGRVLGLIGRSEESLTALRAAWDLDRSRRAAIEAAMLAIAELDAWDDNIDMARALWKEVPPHPVAGAGLALGLARTGRTDQARAVLDVLSGPRIDPQLRARAQAALDEAQKEAADAP